MRRIASPVVLLLLLTSGAQAQTLGIDMAWDACTGSGSERYDKISACAAGVTQRLVCSYTLDQAIELKEARWTIDFQVDAPRLPSWWADGTRFSFSAATNASCASNPWSQSSTAVVQTPVSAIQTGPNRLRLSGLIFFSANEGHPVRPGVEHFSHTLIVNAPEAAADEDCQIQACFRFQELKLYHSDRVTVTVIDSPSFQNHVTWQGASKLSCAAATPARDVTWGSIKALYR